MLTPLKALFAMTACMSLLGCGTQYKSVPQIEKEILLQSSESWDGTPYAAYPEGTPELTLLKLKIPANTALAWHTHPMPNTAYILSGELKVESRDNGLVRVLKPGQTLAEMVNIAHRGVTGNAPVELLVFYAGSPGMPLSEPH